MKEQLERLIAQHQGHLIEFNSDRDHVHILFDITPDVNLAHWIRGLKGAISRKVREKFSSRLQSQLWGGEFWTDSYYLATTGSVTLDKLKRYVENQGRPKYPRQ